MANIWTNAPGDGHSPTRAPKSTAKKLIGSFLVGAMSLGMAWAGVGLVPTGAEAPVDTDQLTTKQAPIVTESGEEGVAQGLAQLDLNSGQILAGAAKVSLRPRAEDYRKVPYFSEARWEQDLDQCSNLAANPEGFMAGASHVADFRVRWAENTDCIFMGGYGIGPMFPIIKWDDEYGLWTRSVALGDGQKTVVLTLIDAVYWEAHYNSLCDGCGFMDLAASLSKATGLPAESFIFASTHSHTSPDFIGGWGAVPEWYMQQATDSLMASVARSLASMRPAVLETGEVLARQRNSERRDFYRSAEDQTLSWFRAVAAEEGPAPDGCDVPVPQIQRGKQRKGLTPAPPPPCEAAAPGSAIATVGAFPAHPVTVDHEKAVADADFPAVFAKNVESTFGGVGMFLQTGLGNVSPRGNKVEMGNGLAGLVPAIGGGTQVTDTRVRVGRTFWDQPVTNVPLGSLGIAGFFDRKFNQTPAVVKEGKGPENRKCVSASPVSVNTSVSAVKIGQLWITGGPGELFSNLTNTIEERNPSGVTMALGLVNDGLGYIIQSFETDHAGRQGVGFAGTVEGVGLSEYEDAYSIDHCFGDATLEKTIGLLGSLRQ